MEWHLSNVKSAFIFTACHFDWWKQENMYFNRKATQTSKRFRASLFHILSAKLLKVASFTVNYHRQRLKQKEALIVNSLFVKIWFTKEHLVAAYRIQKPRHRVVCQESLGSYSFATVLHTISKSGLKSFLM